MNSGIIKGIFFLKVLIFILILGSINIVEPELFFLLSILYWFLSVLAWLWFYLDMKEREK